jgi:hypothetical protein
LTPKNGFPVAGITRPYHVVVQAVNPRMTTFVGGDEGPWQVTSQKVLTGPAIAEVKRLSVLTGPTTTVADGKWVLRGVATNDRYTTESEKDQLVRRQAPIGRPQATHAALILMRKNDDWWRLTQDDRRSILEEQSHHIAIGLRYLPAIARKLLHCRDLGTEEPFDFLGFLDFAPEDEAAFDDMLAELRATTEWSFMDREIDIRLRQTSSP